MWTQKDSQESGEGTGGIGNQWENKNYPDYRIAGISKNTEKSSGDLRGPATTQIPAKDHQQMLVWKTRQE